mmetsp:Transcript_35415/g.40949  ORF Transcript_35415/g.40949 Transcript_35415/m.40949 type:complete len:131 (-) Transcript_35415:51-443(-)
MSNRWGKSQDTLMTEKIVMLCTVMGIDLDAFYSQTIEAMNSMTTFFKVLMRECSWKGDLESLVRRVHTISSSQIFSSRELRRLKSKVKDRKVDTGIDYRRLALEFPGKKIETLKSKVRNVIANRYKRKAQ